MLCSAGGALLPKKRVNPFYAGIDFRRQNLTSKVDPALKELRINNGRKTIGVQMKLKELTKTFMMI